MKTDRTRSEGGEGGEATSPGAPGRSTRTAKIQRQAAGAPLPAGVRGQFEGSLGADLGAVRVHTDGAAAAAAADVQARAFTVGNDIHFGAGTYQPDDPFGMHLLAHEVAHTQQQAGGAAAAQYKLEVSQAGEPAEAEADRAADAMVRGAPAAVTGAGPAIQRKPSTGTEAMHEDIYGDSSLAHGGGPLAPEHLKHKHSGAAFRWDAEPTPKAATTELVHRWLEFFNLAPPIIAGLDAKVKACAFNGDLSTDVEQVARAFVRDARIAGYEYNDFVVRLVVENDVGTQQANVGKGTKAPGEVPAKPDDVFTQEIEITMSPLSKKIGGEKNQPKTEMMVKFGATVLKHGALKADVGGFVTVEFTHEHGAAKPVIKQFGTGLEGQLSLGFFKEMLELQVVAQLMVASELSEAPVRDRLVCSRVVETKLDPSVTGQVVFTLPGTGKHIKIVGGIKASPGGLEASAGGQIVIEF